MKKLFNKMMMMIVTGMMLTATPKPAEALIPLPSVDFSRISENVKKVINQITEIKAEIDSNLAIIREIQNGGFAAAAGMLFAKIENGDYDILGGNILGLKESLDVGVEEGKGAAAARKECNKRAKEKKEQMKSELKQCEGDDKTKEDVKKCQNDVKKRFKKIIEKERAECEQEMNEKTGEAIAEIRRRNVEKAAEKAAKYNTEKKGQVSFNNAYRWVQGANISGAINTTANGGSTGDIISSFGSSAGAILGGAGDENAKLLSGATSVIGGVTNTIDGSEGFKDTIVNGLNNGDINSGFNQIQEGNNDYVAEQNRQAEEEAARRAAEEERNRQISEQMQEYMRNNQPTFTPNQ